MASVGQGRPHPRLVPVVHPDCCRWYPPAPRLVGQSSFSMASPHIVSWAGAHHEIRRLSALWTRLPTLVGNAKVTFLWIGSDWCRALVTSCSVMRTNWTKAVLSMLSSTALRGRSFSGNNSTMRSARQQGNIYLSESLMVYHDIFGQSRCIIRPALWMECMLSATPCCHN